MELTYEAYQGASGNITVLHLKGNLIAETSGDLVSIAEQLYREGSRFLVLDLTHVGYVSSAGLQAIHVVFNILRHEDSKEADSAIKQGVHKGVFKSKHLKLAGLSEKVKQVLTLSGYDMFLEIYPDIESAVRSYGA